MSEKGKCDTHLVLDADLCGLLKGIARAKNMTMKALIVMALREYLVNHKDEIKNLLKNQNNDMINALEKLMSSEYKVVLSHSTG